MYIFLAVLTGIILYFFTNSLIFITIFSAGLIFYLIKYKRNTNYLILPLIIISVFLNCKSRDYSLSDFNGEITGKVIYSNAEKSIVKTYDIKGEKFMTKVLIYGGLERGAVYNIRGKFTEAIPAMNEGNFNSKNNLKSQGIYLYGKIEKAEKIKDANFIDRIATKYSERASNFFEKYLDDRNSNLMQSLILADRFRLDDLDNERFQDLGISHLLAVSGLHIGILVAFLHFIFIKTTKNLKVTDLLVTLIIIFYLRIIGNPISGIRAFLFFVIYKFGFYLRKDLDNKDVFFLSLAAILYINPMAIYSISFLMSYAAIFGIIFVMPIIKSFIANRGVVTDSLIMTLSVIISIFPIVNYYFNGVSILVYPANLIIIPFYTIVIVLGFTMSFGILPSIIGSILNILLNSIYGLEEILLKFNFFNFEIKGFKLEYVFIYYIMLVMILNRHKIYEIIRPNIKIIEIYFAFMLIMFSIGFYKDINSLIYRQIYVGQGDAALISYKGRNYLIDVGGARFDNNIFEKYLKSTLDNLGIYKIDGIFISHYDEDHVGNLDKVYENYEINRIYAGHLPDVDFFNNINIDEINILHEGDRLKHHEKFYFDVLKAGNNGEDENDNSMVLMLSYGNIKILFTGDLSKNLEKDIKEDIDILKVSHHGSNTSTDDVFLENTSPKYAVISSGINNSYGHPHREVLESLEKYGIIYFDTSKVGEITFKIRDKVEIQKYLEKNKINYLYMLLNICILMYIARKNYELQGDLQKK